MIVRKDVPVGVQLAQTIHAAGESSPGQLPPDTFAVALHARDEDHLRRIAERLRQRAFPHHPIFEPDPPWNGQLMSIGVPPMDRALLKKVLSSLPLAR